MNLQPTEAQYYSSIILLPWGFKVIFGMLVDNVRIFNSSRNVYLKISGVFMMLSLIILQLPGIQNKYVALTCLIVYNIFQAIADVVTDAIMVIWARKDPVYGSSDLQMLHVVCVGMGGVFASILSSFANMYFHPYVILRGFWVSSIMLSVLAFFIEEIKIDQFTSLSENLKLSIQHIRKRIVFCSLIFIFLSAAIIPSFENILYFWMINVLNYSKRTIAYFELVAYFSASCGTFLYNTWLK